MAQMQMPHQAVHGQKSSLSKATNALGAIISLALLIGVLVWGYKLLIRDVSGVPVVRAVEGPMRVQPENRGGEQAQNQGLSVNDVAAAGTAAGPADAVMLAPEPVGLTADDAAVSTAADVVPATVPQPVIAPELASALTQEPQTAEEQTLQLAAVEELAARLAEGVEPLQELAPLAEALVETVPQDGTDQTQEVAALVTPKPEIKGGLKRSLRPKTRPAALNTSPTPSAQAIEAAVAGVRDVAPDTIPVGTRLAQLGAYDSEEVARSEWERLNARFGEFLEGKSRVIQKAQSGGRTFYRLRAMGFADLSDARRFCSALVSENAECIPVVTR
ncbi:MAG: SPOR domain-containing protein [Roseovarius sp.]